MPGFAIGQKLQRMFFAGTPLATASAGTIPSFEKMTAANIRDFYHTWYQPSNATVIVSGDIDLGQTLARIRSLFEAIPSEKTPVRPAMAFPPLARNSIQESMDFPIGFGALMYRAPGTNDPDFAASDVLVTALASPTGALADLTATGKTLAAAPIASSFPEIGIASVLAVPAAGGTPQSALSLVDGVIDTYRQSGFASAEVNTAKLLLLSQQAYRQDSISGLGFAWAQAVAQHKSTPDELFESIENVSVDDVNRVMHTYLSPEHQITATILANPSKSSPKVDPSAGLENVGFTPSEKEPLPAWAAAALKVPLHTPSTVRALMVRLPNGVHLSIRREITSPTVVVSGIVRNDSALYEPKNKDGVTLIVNQLLPYGTKTYDRKAFQGQFEAIAASGTLGTSFGVKVLSKYLDRAVELVAQGMLQPAFAPSDFNIVKATVSQTVVVVNKLPKTKADLAERQALYAPGDPPRRDTNEKTIAAISLDDVKKYYSFVFRPDETTIAIVGDVTPAQAEAIVAKYFGAWKAVGPRPTFKYPPIKDVTTKAQTVTITSATNTESEVTLKQRFKMRRTDADYVPLLLANTILSGEGTASMLTKNVRTHFGYVYHIDSDVSVGSDGGEFVIAYASAPKDVNRADAAAIAVVKRLQSAPLPDVELQRAKALLLAQRVLPLESYDGLADDLLSGVNEGYTNTGSDERFWNALVSTTPTQLQRAMQLIDADHFLRVIVSPQT
ncbi:MAG: insulinase family protein [Candidatus Eremiobacteraeota bacterium]|nr:insulinase family protein [Candidatus Eremiobacteraeota bacterium]